MEIHEAEEKLEKMHFDSIVKSYCNKVNDIKRLIAENKEMKEQLRLHNVSNCAIKPPLGLVPKWVRQKERYEEVRQAISRYYNDNREIPTEWVEEYNELVKHCC